MTVVPVADPLDPRLSAYRLVRDRDLAGHGGRFIAEGEVVVRALASPRSRFAIESLLVAATLVETRRALIGSLPADVPVYCAERQVMDALVGFPIHRGVLAVGLRGRAATAGGILDRLPARAVVAVLVGLANHDNVGAAFRNAAAFGADAVLLDETSCDPLYRKAVRVSVGTALQVPFARGGTAGWLLGQLGGAGFDLVALSPGATARIDDGGWGARTALILGSEGGGLPSDVLARTRPVAIAMAPGVDSLNVATAAAIALHEIRRAHPRDSPATGASGPANKEGLPEGSPSIVVRGQPTRDGNASQRARLAASKEPEIQVTAADRC